MARPSGFASGFSILAQKESRAALLPTAYLHRRAHTLDSSLRSEQMFCCTDDLVEARHVVPLRAAQALVGIQDPVSRYIASLGTIAYRGKQKAARLSAGACPPLIKAYAEH